MSSTVDRQIAQAKQSISNLQNLLASARKTKSSLAIELERNRVGSSPSGLKIEVFEQRQEAFGRIQRQILDIDRQIQTFTNNIADLQRFISLESELERARGLKNSIEAVRDTINLTVREKQDLSNEARRILAEFERAKKERVNSNDAQRLADQLRTEQAKAEGVLAAILDPAKAERMRKAQEEAAIRANQKAFDLRVQHERERIAEQDNLERIRELQSRFDNLPLNEFVDKINAEREAKRQAEIEEALNGSGAAADDAETKRTDENAKIKDTLDNFIEGLFGIEQPAQTREALDEQKLAQAYRDSQDLTHEDLIAAAKMQDEAGQEFRVLKELALI